MKTISNNYSKKAMRAMRAKQLGWWPSSSWWADQNTDELNGIENFLRSQAEEISNVDDLLNDLYWDRMHQKIMSSVEARKQIRQPLRSPWRSFTENKIGRSVWNLTRSFPFVSSSYLLSLLLLYHFFQG